jgi:hypothetical protein
MTDLFIFPVAVAVAGFLYMRSKRSIPAKRKKQILAKLIGVAGVTVAVAQPIQNPSLYVTTIAVAVMIFWLPNSERTSDCTLARGYSLVSIVDLLFGLFERSPNSGEPPMAVEGLASLDGSEIPSNALSSDHSPLA